jgi:hypothetical protein
MVLLRPLLVLWGDISVARVCDRVVDMSGGVGGVGGGGTGSRERNTNIAIQAQL